jgi:hypothetical protein
MVSMRKDRSQNPAGRLCAHVVVVLLSRDDIFRSAVTSDQSQETKVDIASCMDSWLNASDEVLRPAGM